MMKYIFTFFIVLFSVFGVSAQSPYECRLSVYTEHDGLSQGRVTSLVQDRDGVLWIATWDGLNRFDGYKFSCYKATPGNHEPLVQNRFDKIVINNENDIWCISRDRFFLFRTETQHFVDIHSLLEKKYNRTIMAYKIVVLGNGITWLVDDDGTLFRIEDKNIDNTEIFASTQPGRRKVYDIRVDSRGNEWLLTDRGVIIVGDVPFKSNLSYKSWIERSGTIWLGTPNGVVSVYGLDTGELSFVEGMPHEVSHLNRMQPVNDSTVLMQTNAGVVFIDVRTRKPELVKLPTSGQQDVTYCYNNNDSRCCLVSRDKKLYSLDMKTRKVSPIEVSGEPLKWIASDITRPLFFKNMRGELFFFLREGGLHRIDMDALTLQPYNAGRFLSPSIRTVFQDNQQNIWVSCNVGLHKLQFGNGEVYPHPGYMKDEVRCLYSDSRGRMWVSSRLGDIEIWEGDKRLGYLSPDGRVVERRVSFGSGVYAIYEDRSRNLWLGTRDEGLYRLSYRLPRQYAITGHYKSDTHNMYSISGDAVYSILQDFKGRLWVGCYDSGLNLVEDPDAENPYFLHENNRLGFHSKNTPQQVRCLAETRDSVILVGTTKGFYTFDENFSTPESIVFYSSMRQKDDQNSLGSNDIMGIEVTRSGDIYLAVFGGGLNKVLTKNLLSEEISFRPYMKRDGAYSDVAINLVEDESGYLWVQTERMLMRFDPQKENFENIGYDMLPRYATLSENKPLIDKDGRLLVPTSLGVYVVSPDRLNNSRYVPAIVFGDGIDSMVLKPEENTLSVPFAAVDFSSNLPVRYAYKLQGVDKDWTYTQENLTANYVNLPAGTFYLRVKSTNRNGLWVDNERVLPVTREPLFAETPWAKALYVLLALVLVAVVVFIYLHIYKLRYKLSLEHRLTEAKLRFFTDISHELRTPLTLIEGPLSEVLADEKLPEADREYLTVVQTNAHRMLNLINQILDFRKIQNGKMKLFIACIDVKELSRHTFESFEHMAQKQHIDYRFSAPAQPIRCYTDADKVEKILFNLLSNAFKYTPDGKGIQVSLDRLEEGFTITVRDEGRGIAPEKIEKIFNRFETLGTPKNSLSTGIGLSLVQELVQLLHGNIQVTSSPENGSTFTVSLPGTSSVYQRDPHAEFILEDVSIPVAEEENSDNISSDEESILIVEDNAELRHFIKYILQDEYNVTTAQNGKEGLDKILSAQPGLVISDIMMPIMDGIELLDTVKRNPDISHTPFILLSAKTSVEDRIKGLEYGADDYITKPFSSSYLKARVRSLLQRRRELKDFYLTQTEEKPEKNDTKQSPDSLTRFDDAFMRQTIQEIENNIQNSNFKIEDLADTQHISRTVFYRKIKSLTGISPIDLIQEIRIRKATEYLEKGELRISEIAYRCGFSSPQYFSRVFKEKTGHSPSEHKGDKN